MPFQIQLAVDDMLSIDSEVVVDSTTLEGLTLLAQLETEPDEAKSA